MKNLKIRQPAVAGSFYPDNKEELIFLIEEFLNSAEKELKQNKIYEKIGNKKLKALISPHAGYAYSGFIAACGYSILRNYAPILSSGAKLSNGANPRFSATILGPSHHVYINKPFADSNDFWETPLGKIKVHQDFIEKIGLTGNSKAHEQEHSIEVQLPFLQFIFNKLRRDAQNSVKFSVAPVALNDPNENLTEKLIKINDNALIIVSSDLSHFLPYKEASEIDKKTIRAIMDLNERKILSLGENIACGLAGIITLARIAKKLNWRPIFLKYLNSGDAAGDKNRVVGYCSIAFFK